MWIFLVHLIPFLPGCSHTEELACSPCHLSILDSRRSSHSIDARVPDIIEAGSPMSDGDSSNKALAAVIRALAETRQVGHA